MKAVTLRCEGCGAPLDVRSSTGGSVRCGYCGRTLVLVDKETARVAEDSAAPASSLTDALLRGYTGKDCGEARRTPGPGLDQERWQATAHSVWPISGRASSSWGGGWSTDKIIGPPRVFPKDGDYRGAWAPATRQSAVEWLEATFPEAGDIKKIRVFETCDPGTTFALTIRDNNGDELIWQQEPRHIASPSQLLEITVDPPRPIRSVRIYVANHLGRRWSEIDTICLYAKQPIPEALRQKPKRRWLTSAGCLVLSLLGMGALVAFGFYTSRADPPPPPEPAASSIRGATIEEWTGAWDTSAISWAEAVTGASSEYSANANSAGQALGPPDVFPIYGDNPAAWAPSGADNGTHWVDLRFDGSLATAVVIVETSGTGAVSRVDDTTDPTAHVTLWEGETIAPARARALRLTLPSSRPITSVRVFLDTERVSGWNELDAIGLIPQ